MRYVIAIALVLVVAGGLVAIKFKQISSLIHFGEEAQKAGAPPESVASMKSEQQVWENTLDAVGSVASSKGVSVSNDSPGLVTKIHFESGQTVKPGDILVELDASVEQAQLASAVARKDLAKTTLDRTKSLSSAGVVAAAQVDNDSSQVRATAGDVAALQAQITKKTIRAPFAGKLGIRLVNLGQYLNPGTPVAVLEAVDTVFVDFTLPQQKLADVAVDMPVRITVEGVEGKPIDGTIVALDPSIDQTTRTIKLRASVPNQADKLRPGMFVNIEVVLPQKSTFVVVPATAVVHAPYGDSVFIIDDKKPDETGITKTADGKEVKMARQVFVKSGAARGDFVAVLEGVKAGDAVVSAGAFKLRNNSPIVLNDELQPKPELDPHPQNR